MLVYNMCLMFFTNVMPYVRHYETLMSSSTYLIFDLFFHSMLVSAENTNSQRYYLENCSKIFTALLAFEGYSSLMENHNF